MTTQTLHSKTKFGPLAGFSNLFTREMGDWWKSKRWLITLGVFVVLIGGMMFLLTGIEEMVMAEQAALAESGTEIDLAELEAELPSHGEMVMMYFLFSGLTVIIAAILLAQSSIVGERQMGTAEWLVSKPITRASFVLSKFAAHGLALAILGVGVQGAISYGILRWRGELPIIPLNFVLASGVLLLAVLFFLALTLMLGTFFDSRAVVAGIPLGLLLLFQYLVMLVPPLAYITPYTLIFIDGNAPESIASQLAMGQAVGSITPVVGTVASTVIFLSLALWRFSREEF